MEECQSGLLDYFAKVAGLIAPQVRILSLPHVK